ncbi:MAG: M36 family metallopeptidase [Myxococcales bacterium]|nr:M36 family metallopeptidase [Myxococcales bacterium]
MMPRLFLRSLPTAALLATAAAACSDGDPALATAPAPLVTALPEHPALARVRVGDRVVAPAATPAAAAVAHVERLAPTWGAPRGVATLASVASLPVAGGTLVRLSQAIDGVLVDRSELRVLVSADGALLAASGVPVPADLARDRNGWRLDASAALAAVTGVTVAPKAGATADEARFAGGAGDVVVDEARVRRRWFRDGDALVPAWVVEAFTSAPDSTASAAERVVVAARDGRVLARRDLTADAFTYRVWADPAGDRRPLDGPTADFSPHPTGAPGAGRPAFVPAPLVSVDGLNHPAGGAADPWLPAGATETVGNNVDAYSDLNPPSGLSAGDFRAATTAAGTFDRAYDVTREPLASTDQQAAAITQLFYGINWLHDDWYDAGFTEAAGNGQTSNFGRGGVEGDALLAEDQDDANGGSRNNANMSTPEDGMSPRMQVFLWTGPDDRQLTVQPTGATPATRAPTVYGPRAYDLTATVAAGQDGGGMSADDGCEAITSNVAGRIVLVNRGNCSGELKAANAQAAGAAGVIIAHNVTGSAAPGLPDDANVTTPITIPVMSVGNADGAALRAALAGGAVTATMHRTLAPEIDGAVDASLVAHEFGHYVHHRLSDCGTAMCGAMSEGWGDFIALMTMASDGDNLGGVYAIGGAAFGGDPYFGLRRAPYSTDATKNAFTYRLVAEGEPLPTSHPTSGGGPNSEVHNAGEIWAEVMWEGYVALQQARGSASFAETRKTMQRYIVGGLLMAPPDATFTETRSAILAAARAVSPADAATLAAAFARRGLGSCAESPPRSSQDFIGAVEDATVRGNAAPESVTLAIDVKNCDSDGALDVGETATITVPVVNVGADALAGVTVSAATTTPGLTLLTTSADLGAMAPDARGTATFQVRLDAATGPAAATVDVTIAAAGGCVTTRQVVLPLRLAADDVNASSATDAFDALTSPWTKDGLDADRAWNLEGASALDRHWRGADLGTLTDTSLISPPLQAGGGAVTIAFDHSYQFEFSSATYFDGGVIEVSTDDGTTWRDASMLTAVPYDGVLTGDSGNPLADRMAFGEVNPSYPARDHLVLDFGTQLANQTFRLRFRIGTDQAVSGEGWIIDNLVATGLTNTPFPTVAGDADACTPTPPGEDDGGCCSTGSGPGASVLGGLGVAALLGRRRRRR